MNSMIISAFFSFCKSAVECFKKSGTMALLMCIYNFFSENWRKSRIMTFLRKDRKTAENSFLYKFIHTPFSALEFIGGKIGKRLKNKIECSVLLSAMRDFLNAFLALNSRFLGIVMISALTVRCTLYGCFSALYVIFALISVLLLFADMNTVDFFKDSKAVNLVLSVIGFENCTFDFYEKYSERTANCLAVLFGAAVGILSFKSVYLLLPFAAVMAGIVLMYPLAGVFFALCSAPFVPTMLLAGICLLTFAAFIVKAITAEGFRFYLDGCGTLLGLFLIFMMISSLLSFSPIKSIQVWGMYLIFAGFYFVITNTVETKKQLHTILKAFVTVGFFVSLYGVLQYIFKWNTSNAWIDEDMFSSATMRAYSTMENPNVLGELLFLLIPLSAVFMIKGNKFREKLFYAVIFAVNVLCMVFTQSRGCWIGLILSAVIFITFYNGKLWGFLPIVLVILPFVIPETVTERMMSVGDLNDTSTSYRVFIWLGTVEMLKKFLLGGIGMGEGAFRTVYPLYSYNGIIAPHSHNTFLQLAVEGGVFALLIFLAVIVVFMKKMHNIYQDSEKNSVDRLLPLAIGCGVAGFMLQSMFDYTFYNYRMMAMFFMILAMGISAGKEGLK